MYNGRLSYLVIHKWLERRILHKTLQLPRDAMFNPRSVGGQNASPLNLEIIPKLKQIETQTCHDSPRNILDILTNKKSGRRQ